MLKIKRAQRSDLAFIYDCVCNLEDTKFNSRRFKLFFYENLGKSDNIYLIAADTNAIGFLSCHVQPLLHHCSRIAEVQEMYVVPEARNKGVGKALVTALKKIVRSKNISQIEVTSNIRRRRAHRFYTSEGFHLTSKKFVLPLTD